MLLGLLTAPVTGRTVREVGDQASLHLQLSRYTSKLHSLICLS